MLNSQVKKILKNSIALINLVYTKKRIFYYSPNEHNIFGKTAVKTKFDFWCVGNVLDEKDIACGILNYGEIEPEETDLIITTMRFLAESKKVSFFDIGANTGYYGLLIAKLLGTKAEVNSFEPVKEYSDCIKASANMNRLENLITVHNIGLSNIEAKKNIYVSGTCSSLEENFNQSFIRKDEVRLRRLDDIVNISPPDFLKIDVEGHELMMLRGAVNTIKEYKPIIFIEIIQRLDSHNFDNKNYKDTIKLLNDLDYDSYLFTKNKLTPLTNSSSIEGIHMYLFIHKNDNNIKNLLEEKFK